MNSFHMICQMRFSFESCKTQITFSIFMFLQMFFQATIIWKWTITFWTLKWFFPFMNWRNVTVDMGFFLEGFRTNMTCIWPIFLMNRWNMSIQNTFDLDNIHDLTFGVSYFKCKKNIKYWLSSASIKSKAFLGGKHLLEQFNWK